MVLPVLTNYQTSSTHVVIFLKPTNTGGIPDFLVSAAVNN